MVHLIIGHKGTGKTKTMIDLANKRAKDSDGHIVFINKNYRLTYDLIHEIRVVCMDD
jgi:Tfp pilus assembly ATPase PilU